MFSEGELLEAIDELENSSPTYQNCEKLSTFYTLYDHLYGGRFSVEKPTKEVIIDGYGGSEFLRTIKGRKADGVWKIMDELMETIRLLQPRLYQATMEKISE